ncbi:MAG: glycosyltransferase family 1 protein [Alphaproteobacteria bacterium]|nr:MAG: glycosyltransferase family 1 protein [Alphaproteobacteria bacterium]
MAEPALEVAASRARVVAVIQLPPPVTGLGAVNERMIQAFREAGVLHALANMAPPRRPGRLRKVAVRLWRTLSACRIVLHSRLSGARTLYMPSDAAAGMALNLIILLVARACGYRIWFHHHNYSYVERRSRLMSLLLSVSPERSGHVFLCHGMMERFRTLYAREWTALGHHGQVLSNAFMIDDAAVAGKTPSGPLVMGHLSNLSVAKGTPRFIELFSTLRRNGVAVRARLAGPVGDEETARAIKAASQVHGPDFEWLGPVYGSDKAAFFGSIDVFVFPSAYVNEAQPLVLLEALSGGAAVIATARGCTACDHANSPGLVADDAEFDAEAFACLRALAVAGDREDLRSRAIRRFHAMKSSTAYELADVINAVGGQPNSASR